MKLAYVVVVPTPMGGAFITERGLSSEYPSAKKFPGINAAKLAARAHCDAQVYSTIGYEQGDGPVWVSK